MGVLRQVDDDCLVQPELHVPAHAGAVAIYVDDVRFGACRLQREADERHGNREGGRVCCEKHTERGSPGHSFSEFRHH